MAQYQLLSQALAEIQHGNHQGATETISKYIDSLPSEAQEERKVAIRFRIDTNLKSGKMDGNKSNHC
ncbi:unnamed protein product [Rotaria sp. Silwood1]|nr:unnamed protein product [Rotaria sp. Silwood1]CAF1650230.1 unnamed protein product [Rotaria sp. Silwood1]CAF3784728.1 unnamed protein product [Rotaria sp. Silwood1]